eukprot:scaffold56171_cov63-Phaeocystis_antarctica.AAC.2
MASSRLLAILTEDPNQLSARDCRQKLRSWHPLAGVKAQIQSAVGLRAESSAHVVKLRRRDANVKEHPRHGAWSHPDFLEGLTHRAEQRVVDGEARVCCHELLACSERCEGL